ncbi:hypothetical protein ACVWZV_001640 [Bradyrhizobium sp. GM5.1]
MRKRLKASRTSGGVQGFHGFERFLAGALGFAAATFAFFFGTDVLRGAGVRVIFAMIGIY